MIHTVRMKEPKHRLQHAREAAGYESPSDAARKLKINKNTLISHENGHRPISRNAAEKYGALFGVRAGWLLFGETDTSAAAPSIDRLQAVLAKAGSMSPELQARIIDFAEFEIERYGKDRETETNPRS